MRDIDPALVEGRHIDADTATIHADRTLPIVRVRRPSPNKSSRNGAAPRLIVVHSSEGSNVAGLADLASLGSWFAERSTQASSHVATDGEGNSARYVSDEDKAWHCMQFNSVSLGIEQIGRASQTSWPAPQLHETARWIAYWSRKHGIPIQHGDVGGGSVARAGIVRHSDLGVLGGRHSDPGRSYPLAEVLALAQRYRRR
jgi:N-acetyl-anhydromuramyl-L-alanine amidase AmpD